MPSSATSTAHRHPATPNEPSGRGPPQLTARLPPPHRRRLIAAPPAANVLAAYRAHQDAHPIPLPSPPKRSEPPGRRQTGGWEYHRSRDGAAAEGCTRWGRKGRTPAALPVDRDRRAADVAAAGRLRDVRLFGVWGGGATKESTGVVAPARQHPGVEEATHVSKLAPERRELLAALAGRGAQFPADEAHEVADLGLGEGIAAELGDEALDGYRARQARGCASTPGQCGDRRGPGVTALWCFGQCPPCRPPSWPYRNGRSAVARLRPYATRASDRPCTTVGRPFWSRFCVP